MLASRWIDLVVCAAQLALAFAARLRLSRAPAARPLALFSLCVVAWSAAAIAFDFTGLAEWTLADHAISPLSAPLALDFALTFDGRRRAQRPVLATAYVLCSLLGAVSICALVYPPLRPFVGSRAWTVALLCIGAPTMAFALVSFVSHLQRSVNRLEEERTRLVIAAFAISAVLGSTDVLAPLAPAVPSLGKLGLLVGSLVTALVSLQYSWFETPSRVRRFTYALAAMAVGMLVYISRIGFADALASRLVLGTVAATTMLIAASRRWAVDAALQKERVSQLARLGRFSAQMAHDVKNPLAALKGAAQLLGEDVALVPPPSRKGPSPSALVDVMLEQIDRLVRVVDTYGRLARIEVISAPLDMNEVVREVIALHALAPPKGITLRADLAPDLVPCPADKDMLASVLENLVRNALEALPLGGSVVVRTAHVVDGASHHVVLTVEDTGVGMSAQTRERAFEDFFTTKPTGSGLGLAFVRRVVEAHGGDVTLASEEGRGTVVKLRLPES